MVDGAESKRGQDAQVGVPTIRLKTSLLVPGLHSEEIPLTEQVATIGALILDICRRTHVDLLDQHGDLIDFVDVKLNGQNVNLLPAALTTILQPGDRVVLQLIPIGGG